MKAVIMAGGKGTRMESVNGQVPKPMILICGKPVLQYQIEVLKRQGVKDIILVIGHLGGQIEDYFGTGERFGVRIQYIREGTPLGTAGALYYLRGRMAEDFLLLNGDIIWDVDLGRFAEAHYTKGGLATILTHPNSHPYDSGVILAEESGAVTKWLTKEERRGWYRNRVNAGLHMLSPRLLTSFEVLRKMDLDRDVLKNLIPGRQLFVYDSPEYVKDMGTPDRYSAVSRDVAAGLVECKNLSRPQKAFFLDRDGTINKYVGFLTDIDDFELIEGAAKAIRLINEHGFLAIVITNQPVIARGEVSLDGLREIHNKMETLLGQEGAYVDDIFCCPHHPDKGFPGERLEYKKDCSCRKPKPGLILEAARKYNVDLSQSVMAGDGAADVEAGKRAGCKTAFIGKGKMEGTDSYSNLLTCVEQILNVRGKS